jgi:curli biogenesis system outer membrane secretion channel CsgG
MYRSQWLSKPEVTSGENTVYTYLLQTGNFNVLAKRNTDTMKNSDVVWNVKCDILYRKRLLSVPLSVRAAKVYISINSNA